MSPDVLLKEWQRWSVQHAQRDAGYTTLMCGRYLTPSEADIERHWELRPLADYHRSYNVAPTHLAPVVRQHSHTGERDLSMLRWGFEPAWADRGWINARVETAWTNRMFRSSAAKRRCLVPAVGWYEWQGEHAPKQPYVLHLGELRPFSLAGVWTAKPLNDGWMHSFAILTRPAEAAIRGIHGRMPALVHPRHYGAWLSPDTPPDVAQQIVLEPVERIETYPVTTHVNKAGNDDERCIDPLVSRQDPH